MKVPRHHFNGKRLVKVETVYSVPNLTEEEARKVIEAIRSNHTKAEGWLEIEAKVVKTASGGYVSFRRHAKYE